MRELLVAIQEHIKVVFWIIDGITRAYWIPEVLCRRDLPRLLERISKPRDDRIDALEVFRAGRVGGKRQAVVEAVARREQNDGEPLSFTDGLADFRNAFAGIVADELLTERQLDAFVAEA